MTAIHLHYILAVAPILLGVIAGILFITLLVFGVRYLKTKRDVLLQPSNIGVPPDIEK